MGGAELHLAVALLRGALTVAHYWAMLVEKPDVIKAYTSNMGGAVTKP